MLEKPEIQDAAIVACLRGAYDLPIRRLTFLPIGADQNTAVYHAMAAGGASHFVKLRGDTFDPTSVTLPRFLYDQGVQAIIPPLATRSGALWTNVDRFKLIVYPYMFGRDGYEVPLSERHWVEFGAAVRSIHSSALPPSLVNQLQSETFAPNWRESLRTSLKYAKNSKFDDPVATELAIFLCVKRDEILALVGRAEEYAETLQASPLDLVLCHSDLHAGNILIDESEDLYIVDWDDPILAPKERDLMYPGGAQGFIGRSAQEEERLFYHGYGPTEIDPAVLTYYRFERIIQDMAIYCEGLLTTTEGGRDREQSLRYLKSNFQRGGTIAMAYRADRNSLERQNRWSGRG
jgi:spectinomycin phosphotransferase